MMNSQLLLLAIGLTAAAAHFTTGGDFCTDEKNRYDTCQPLVSHDGCKCGSGEKSGEGSPEVGSGSGSGNSSTETSTLSGSGSGSGGQWGKGEYCLLFQYFLEFSLSITDVSIRVGLNNCICWLNLNVFRKSSSSGSTKLKLLLLKTPNWLITKSLFKSNTAWSCCLKHTSKSRPPSSSNTLATGDTCATWKVWLRTFKLPQLLLRWKVWSKLRLETGRVHSLTHWKDVKVEPQWHNKAKSTL